MSSTLYGEDAYLNDCYNLNEMMPLYSRLVNYIAGFLNKYILLFELGALLPFRVVDFVDVNVNTRVSFVLVFPLWYAYVFLFILSSMGKITLN